MGYTTEFYGSFKVDKDVNKSFFEYIHRFSRTRHMKRDVEKIKIENPDWKNNCFNGDLGKDGSFYVTHNQSNMFGQNNDESIIDYNQCPDEQPGLWCDWELFSDDDLTKDLISNCELKWNGTEKFYSYIEWLEYLFINFFMPNDYLLNGVMLSIGEEEGDALYIISINNKVYTFDAMDEKSKEKIESYFGIQKVIMDDFNKLYKCPEDLISEYWNY